jgi:hypothetical protein
VYLAKIIIRIMANSTPWKVLWMSQGVIHLPQEYIFSLMSVAVNNLK